MSGWDCGRSTSAISKCCTVRCGWDFWTRGSIPFSAPCTSRCGAAWGWRKPESPWKCRTVESLEIQKQDFHPSHPPWKSPKRFPHSHRHDDSSYDQSGARTNSEKCYLCPRIEVLPMFPVGQSGRPLLAVAARFRASEWLLGPEALREILDIHTRRV